jgi:hypothetical protein
MTTAIAVFLASAIASPAAEIPPEQLVGTFAAACLDGSVNLAPNQASKMAFSELPAPLRKRLGKPKSGQVWQLNSPGRAYLYVLDYEPGRKTSRMICGVASDELPLHTSVEALRVRFGGATLRGSPANTEWMFPEDGYFAAATSTGTFNVLQVRWLSDEQKRLVLREFRSIGAKVPKSREQPSDDK